MNTKIKSNIWKGGGGIKYSDCITFLYQKCFSFIKNNFFGTGMEWYRSSLNKSPYINKGLWDAFNIFTRIIGFQNLIESKVLKIS